MKGNKLTPQDLVSNIRQRAELEEAGNQQKERIARNRKLEKKIRELSVLDASLNEDLMSLQPLLKSEEFSDPIRRNAFRAIFAGIEGSMHGLKKIILNTPGSLHDAQLSVAEIAMLKELSYSVESNGRVREKPQYISLKDNVRFTFRTAAKAFGLEDIHLEVDKAGWQSFSEAIDIRNRITHPKSVDGIKISDGDLEIAVAAMRWFHQEYSKLIEAVKEKTQERKNQLLAEHKHAMDERMAGGLKLIEYIGWVADAQKSMKGLVASSDLSEEIKNELKNVSEILHDYQELLRVGILVSE